MKLADYYIHTQAELEVAEYIACVSPAMPTQRYYSDTEEGKGEAKALYEYFTQWFKAIVEIAEEEHRDGIDNCCISPVAIGTIQEWYDELSFHEKLTLTEIPPYVTTTH